MSVLREDIIAKELCEAWGLQASQVGHISIELTPGDAVKAFIQYYPDKDTIAILKKYHLIEA